MPVDPTYGRHYRGAPDREMQAGAWKCPACRTQHTTPLEAGCPSCGAGTPEEAAQAAAARVAVPTLEELLLGLVPAGVAAPQDVALCVALSTRARLTLARALAHYGETGAPSPSELTRMQCLGWGRALADTID